VIRLPKPPKREAKAPKRIARGKRPRKQRKSPRARLIREADLLAREIAMQTGHCEACGAATDLQWAHAYSRRYLKTRWTWTYCLCRGCHYKYTLRWEAWLEWLLAKEGPTVLRTLQMKALDPIPMSKADIEAVIEQLKTQLGR
jgi:hypothetical protein